VRDLLVEDEPTRILRLPYWPEIPGQRKKTSGDGDSVSFSIALSRPRARPDADEVIIAGADGDFQGVQEQEVEHHAPLDDGRPARQLVD
jgi:hypothetical protein